MSQSNSSLADRILLASAGIVVLSAFVSFQVISEEELLIRSTVLAVGILISLFLALKSLPGQNFIGFFRDSIQEMRRVVWPTKKETFQTVLIVFVFVLLVSIFLWMADKSFEWILYELVLGWK
jgi:preprotein translocase subunit SecE